MICLCCVAQDDCSGSRKKPAHADTHASSQRPLKYLEILRFESTLEPYLFKMSFLLPLAHNLSGSVTEDYASATASLLGGLAVFYYADATALSAR
jgi:hypothetical protein